MWDGAEGAAGCDDESRDVGIEWLTGRVVGDGPSGEGEPVFAAIPVAGGNGTRAFRKALSRVKT
jgi:hypothetical protein